MVSFIYKAYKDQVAFGKRRKVVFIKVMMTKSLWKIRGNGLHQGNDDQIPSENQRKWSSLSR